MICKLLKRKPPFNMGGMQDAVGVVGDGRRLKLSQNSINIISLKVLTQNTFNFLSKIPLKLCSSLKFVTLRTGPNPVGVPLLL